MHLGRHIRLKKNIVHLIYRNQGSNLKRTKLYKIITFTVMRNIWLKTSLNCSKILLISLNLIYLNYFFATVNIFMLPNRFVKFWVFTIMVLRLSIEKLLISVSMF